MRLNAASLARQCYVDEILIVTQIFERRCYAALVVVPAQTEMLCLVHFGVWRCFCLCLCWCWYWR